MFVIKTSRYEIKMTIYREECVETPYAFTDHLNLWLN